MKTPGLIIAGLILLLSGCGTMPNSISQSTSDFDGTTELEMKPGFVYKADGGWDFKLALHWRSSMGEGLIIRAIIPRMITNITSDEGLLFNVDGDVISLNSPDFSTTFDTSSRSGWGVKKSSKEFITGRAFLDLLLSADDVKVKLRTPEGYLEGDLTLEKSNAAIHGFREFAARLDKLQASDEG